MVFKTIDELAYSLPLLQQRIKGSCQYTVTFEQEEQDYEQDANEMANEQHDKDDDDLDRVCILPSDGVPWEFPMEERHKQKRVVQLYQKELGDACEREAAFQAELVAERSKR